MIPYASSVAITHANNYKHLRKAQCTKGKYTPDNYAQTK